MRDQILPWDQNSSKILLAEHDESILPSKPISSISAAPITSTAIELPDSGNRDVVTPATPAGHLGMSSQSKPLQIENIASPGVHGPISNNSSVSGESSRKRKLSIDEAESGVSAEEMRAQKKR